MTQTAQEVLDRAKQNAAQAKADQPERNSKKKKTEADTNLESALARVSDAQHQNGLKLVHQIGEKAFLQGITEGVSKYLAQDLDDSQFDAIASHIQTIGAKRLAASNPATLTLPASAFLVRLAEDDEDEEEDEDV
jgi:hypothetical protein